MTSDTAQIVVAKSAAETFTFLSDPEQLDLWSLGNWRNDIADDGLVHGQSIFNGQTNLVRIYPYADQLLIDYAVGATEAELVVRIFARIISGEQFGQDQASCMLLLTALRTASMDDERWQGLKSAHAFEVTLIKALLESGYDHRAR